MARNELSQAFDQLMKRIASLGADDFEAADELLSESAHVRFPYEGIISPVVIWVTDDGSILELDCRQRQLMAYRLGKTIELQREDMRPDELEGILTLIWAAKHLTDEQEAPETSESDEDASDDSETPQKQLTIDDALPDPA